MNTSQRSRGSLPIMVCSLFFVATLLVPLPAAANSSDIAPRTEDPDCGTWKAGLVNNRSSFNVRIRGNLYEGGPDETFTLTPGQNNRDHTDLCDVDNVNVQEDHWFLWHWRNSDSWPKIRSWNIICVNDWVPIWGTFVKCAAIWMGPPGEEPSPVDPPSDTEREIEPPSEPDDPME